MRKNIAGFTLCASLLALCVSAQAQQPKNVSRIGLFIAVPPSVVSARLDVFRQRLRELGYVEGKNVIIESRSAEGKLERLPALAAEFVSLKVDVIVSGGPQATRAAKVATKSTPIVMAQDTDPVGNGFVASLARPGGNITGLSQMNPELAGKRLELLREVVPRLSRVAVFGTSTQPDNAQSLKETELAARAYRLRLQYLDVLGSKDLETAFRDASKGQADAGLVLGGPVLFGARVAEIAAKSRLPVIHNRPEFVEDWGGLMMYGVSFNDLFRRAAEFVDKILKGAKPADLPVEQATKFELVINLKTAKTLNLTIPQWTLMKADRVVR